MVHSISDRVLLQRLPLSQAFLGHARGMAKSCLNLDRKSWKQFLVREVMSKIRNVIKYKYEYGKICL